MRPIKTFCAMGLATTIASSAAAQTIVGAWSAHVNWSASGQSQIVMVLGADGRIETTTANADVAFRLSGAYRYDPAHSVLQYRWSDYAPKKICVDDDCRPAPPPAPMGLTMTDRIHFLNANAFVASSSDGSTTFVRSDATRFPAP
jgi:hypothetical protein